ncbi:hypothetical protein JW887_03195 [Candidatus Dojkabacteria bacterium]|nr:hypothetical protein [Candidatus Dojkabacteria bacterium]
MFNLKQKIMIEIANLQTLRGIVGSTNGELYYVKGHTNPGDGGGGIFMWRTEYIFKTGIYQNDNNGTIIKTTSIPGQSIGRWVRQYEGYINVLFFGAFGKTQDYTSAFQNAIDYASLNALNDPELKGSVVYIPNGNYRINQLLLKNGISILGESITKTFIQSTVIHNVDYMFKIEVGPVFLNLSNFSVFGRNETNAGCFLFEAQPLSTDPYHGGLWNSKINDIKISGFKGHGIYLKGSGNSASGNGNLPNQFNIFENVRVSKASDYSNALKMEGQNGQISFINCTFDGFTYTENDVLTYSKGHNINIKNKLQFTSAVISFINCTCQSANYGFYIEWAENITIDNCWFENLGVAITVKSNYSDAVNEQPSKGVTITNNRFANASGFGSLIATNNIKTGQCISVSKSYVSVLNNYSVVTNPDSQDYSAGNLFLLATNNNLMGGITISGNTFQVNKLGKTTGVMQVIAVSNNTIDCSGNKLLFVSGSTSIVKTIKSSINAGEYLTIRANGSSVTFDNTNNIFLTLKSSLTLNNGEIATFVKIDNSVGSNYETYQLVSVMKGNTIVT